MPHAILFFLSTSFLGKASCLDFEAQHAQSLREKPPYIFITPATPPRERNKEHIIDKRRSTGTLFIKLVSEKPYIYVSNGILRDVRLNLIAMAQGQLPEAPWILTAIMQSRALARTPVN